MILRTCLSIAVCLLAGTAGAIAQHNELTPEEQAEGWKLLFDGKTAPGFRGVQKQDFLRSGWKIEDGALLLTKTIKQSGRVTGGDVATVQQFTDFDFRFSWKITVSGNTGVRYLGREQFGQAPKGFEYQIIDDMRHPDGLKGGPIHRTGALYGLMPPAETRKINDVDQWNEGRIVVQGQHVEHWLNGEKILECELDGPELAEALRVSKVRLPPSFGSKFPSRIVLLDQGEEVAFRDLKIRILSLQPPTR